MTRSASRTHELLRRPSGPWRRILDRGFGVVAYAATFFGLAMLAVFFGRIGWDVATWFRTMPAEIRAQNAVLERQFAEAQSPEFLAKELAKINEDEQRELKTAANDEEREDIRKDYAKIRDREQQVAETKRQEIIRNTEVGLRPTTSAPALFGNFLVGDPSNEPQDAGVLPALLGSVWMAVITLLAAVPLGVGAAIYLEEYRQKSWLARLIQVNINNLAGVPSVLYGVLGAFVFVELIFRPMEDQYPGIAARNVLGGGLTLALLTLPVIIVSAQEAIRAVPVSIRHAALALGATRWQAIWHHVLPSAAPGILTGIILALSRALGEAAPLVLFGAIMFVSQYPTLFSRFTVLPMQIFDWSGRPKVEWQYNAGLASAVLVLTLLALNAVAIYLRQRAQRQMKW